MEINKIAISALIAYQKKLNVSANNIANVNTEGFKPSEAEIKDNADRGVYVTISQSETPGVDLSKEFVDVMIAEQGFKANLKSIKTDKEIIKSILDIIV